MEPDKETSASPSVRFDACSRIAIVSQACEKRVQQTQIIVQLTGCLDIPRLLKVVDERHESGGSAPLPPASKTDWRT